MSEIGTTLIFGYKGVGGALARNIIKTGGKVHLAGRNAESLQKVQRYCCEYY